MAGEFFDGLPESEIIVIGQVIDFVTLDFGDDEGVEFGFWVDVEEGEGFVVLIDFVARNFSRDDF